jgi:flavin reductase (DIM6/NTAB) family NADH-FMN oxidoreductase RutF
MEERKWKAIEPTDVKNAVELFDKDWMVLAAGKEGNFNAMTISWGQMGELWNKPVIIVYVRDSRYTKEFIDKNDHFTVSAFPNVYHKALAYIGSHSGRNEHKLSIVGLNPEFTVLGNPTFKEATLCIECKIIYKHRMESSELPSDVISQQYSDGDLHTMYVGEIVNVMER